MKKTMKIIKNIFNVLITTFVILFVIVVCLQRFSNNRISIFSYRMFTVVSGSMEPKYKIGDVLIAKEIAPSKIKVGDAISYLGKVGTFKDKVVTHQVIEIEKSDDGKYIYHTKGLSNIIEDPIVYEDQLYGKVIYKTMLLSFIYSIISLLEKHCFMKLLRFLPYINMNQLHTHIYIPSFLNLPPIFHPISAL